MRILQIETGLFPDAARVAEAVQTLRGTHVIEKTDVTGLAPGDDDAWAKLARAIMAADRIVTL